MRKQTLMILMTLLLFMGCNFKPENNTIVNTKGLIGMIKTAAGFNIYSNKGILILEYTKQNCDSSSLRTLDEIYHTSKEFFNQEELKKEKLIQPREVSL